MLRILEKKGLGMEAEKVLEEYSRLLKKEGLLDRDFNFGFTEEEARSIIVRGFLSVELTGLPENLIKYLEGILDSLAASF